MMTVGMTMRTLDWGCLGEKLVGRSVVYSSKGENIISNRAGSCAKSCASNRRF
jgi:hypothetical protein